MLAARPGRATPCPDRHRARPAAPLERRGLSSVRMCTAAQYARTVAGDQRDRIDLAVTARPFFAPRRLLRGAGPPARRGPGPRVRARLLGGHPLRGHPGPQPRPGRFCSGRGALVNDPLRAGGDADVSRSILHMDPPEHATFRSLVNRRFTPRALAGLADVHPQDRVALLDAVETPAARSTSWPSWPRPSRSSSSPSCWASTRPTGRLPALVRRRH